jgi:hypothetical protein
MLTTLPAPVGLDPHLTLDLDRPGLLVVLGADPRAEALDRPLGDALARALNQRLAVRAQQLGRALACAVTITDLWYLNNSHLRVRPAISVGGPDVNAWSAFLVGRLPVVQAQHDRWAVHADLHTGQPAACCWGVDAPATRTAIEQLLARHIDPILAAAEQA